MLLQSPRRTAKMGSSLFAAHDQPLPLRYATPRLLRFIEQVRPLRQISDFREEAWSGVPFHASGFASRVSCWRLNVNLR